MSLAPEKMVRISFLQGTASCGMLLRDSGYMSTWALIFHRTQILCKFPVSPSIKREVDLGARQHPLCIDILLCLQTGHKALLCGVI